MGRPKGSRNKKGRIEYPRKCEHCDYVSNNPSMYHYHLRVHEEISDGQLCDHGCNQPAKFRNTKGSYTCEESAFHCPAYLERHSEKVKNDWKDNNSRKLQTIKNLENSIHSISAIEKSREAAKARAIIDVTEFKSYRSYARKCRKLAQQWAKDNGYEIGRESYHVDHKVSLARAYEAGLSIDIASHPANLQILESRKNSAKGAKCSITIEQLLEEIRKS
jgi:hypothetical protein